MHKIYLHYYNIFPSRTSLKVAYVLLHLFLPNKSIYLFFGYWHKRHLLQNQAFQKGLLPGNHSHKAHFYFFFTLFVIPHILKNKIICRIPNTKNTIAINVSIPLNFKLEKLLYNSNIPFLPHICKFQYRFCPFYDKNGCHFPMVMYGIKKQIILREL